MRHLAAWACGAAVVWMVGVAPAPSRAEVEGARVSELAPVAARAMVGDVDAARVLRAAGPAGLSALVDAGVAEAGRAAAGDRRSINLDSLYARSLDLVCAQADCASSRLYWYTDFAAARAEAERSGKPIVLLRLLGRLDEQLSCANSRYFRLILYSDPAISGWLRDNVVLYWTSERPVPQVSVDFGDGRRLVGTVTGNSIHYMLDSHGRLVDAMPGLHTPQRFLAWLQDAGAMAGQWEPLDDKAFAARSRSEHERLDRKVLDELVAELVQSGWSKRAAREAWLAEPVPEEEAMPPTADEAARLALSKSVAESPLLAAVGRRPLAPEDSNAVSTLALTRRWGAYLSPKTRALVEAQAPAAAREDLKAALLRLEVRLAKDGLRNEAFLHRAIHQEMARASGLWTWQNLNTWVYSELFLTPAYDPWLGLAPTELLGALVAIAPSPDLAATAPAASAPAAMAP
ncbi:MAG TPA: hypothetical protein VFS60_14850 [Thermoanaerobaculia bacterium]|nr:hypothetical protein [Thermoanaerobaculia bacterium]